MYIPKRYGQSRIDRCPFCDKQATAKNKQGIPVCAVHKNSIMNEMKCACGEYLELKNGKYGIFFNCMKCGNMNLMKVLEINEIIDVNNSDKIINNQNKSQKTTEKKTDKRPKEITVSSDDPLYFE